MFVELKKQLAENKQLYLKIKVMPNASLTQYRDTLADGTLKIAIAAVPEKGRANLALIKYLAKGLGVMKSQIDIISGAGQRTKLIKIVL